MMNHVEPTSGYYVPPRDPLMSLFRCPACHLPITDTEIQAGECGCGHKLVVNQATVASQTTRKQGKEVSTTGSNLILLGIICAFVAALSIGLWRMTEAKEAPPPPKA